MVKITNSSSIKEITYQKQTKNMYVHLRDGTHVQYHDVPEEVYKSFLKVKSKGEFYNYEVRSKYLFSYL